MKLTSSALTVAALASLVALPWSPVDRSDASSAALGVAALAAPFISGGVCLPRATPDQLDTLFDTEPGGVAGADYQRATELPNGNVLWTFQDAEVRRPDGTLTLVHNIGIIQTGTCFSVLMTGSAWDPQPWLFSENTQQFQTWYWPLDTIIGDDGRPYIFVAEMNESGASYLTKVTPTATLVAAFDVENWNIVFQGAPPNSSPELYGWTAESDNEWTYLYAHCYRQFGFDDFFGVAAHDFDCADQVTVARVVKGRVFDPLEYWTGTGWAPNAASAVAVIETAGRLVNPSDIIYRNNQWLAVTKVNDWFGHEILVEASSRPTGPFEQIANIPAEPKCGSHTCNTYYASWIPTADQQQQLTIGLSHNRWDGVFSGVYRPTYMSFATPEYEMSPADRCSIGQCD